MDANLKTSIDEKLKALELEKKLFSKAMILYRTGLRPKNISSAQFSAISARIERAPNVIKAKGRVEGFLRNQLEKLSKKQKRGLQESWLKPPDISSEYKSLGELAIAWIKHDRYLPEQGQLNEKENLAALRRFWGFLSGLYSYEMTFQKGMPIKEEAA